jgi:hypothetical protein
MSAVPDTITIHPAAPEDVIEWPPLFRGAPPTDYEKRVYGEDAEVDEITGFIFERGTGALSKEVQRARFKANLTDPDWCLNYLRNDPHAQTRHPALWEHYKDKLA